MRLGRRHEARDATDYLELADGRTSMKNTDAVFVRRRMEQRTLHQSADVFIGFRSGFRRDRSPDGF
jgi:hypothetical protein